MGATRKLQGEIDRVLKKVQEGVEVFDGIWNKVYDTDSMSQKEKFEADLKKEIKKLQRYRDQIKTWIQSSDIKDKKALIDARKLIEREMERFKVCEKETKTKAFSKEGLGQQPKTDPREKAKGESRDWLNNMVSELETQIDSFESEMEGLQVKKGKQRPTRLIRLEDSVTRHKAHITKLEMVLRLLDNDEFTPEEVTDIKDLVEDYIERNQDDFEEFEDVDELYESLPMEKLEALENMEAVPAVPASVAAKEKGSEKDKKLPHGLPLPPVPLIRPHPPLPLAATALPPGAPPLSIPLDSASNPPSSSSSPSPHPLHTHDAPIVDPATSSSTSLAPPLPPLKTLPLRAPATSTPSGAPSLAPAPPLSLRQTPGAPLPLKAPLPALNPLLRPKATLNPILSNPVLPLGAALTSRPPLPSNPSSASSTSSSPPSFAHDLPSIALNPNPLLVASANLLTNPSSTLNPNPSPGLLRSFASPSPSSPSPTSTLASPAPPPVASKEPAGGDLLLPHAASSSSASSSGLGEVLPPHSHLQHQSALGAAQQRMFNSVGIQWRPGMPSSAAFHGHSGDGFLPRAEISPDQKQRYVSRFQQVQQGGGLGLVGMVPGVKQPGGMAVGASAPSASSAPSSSSSSSLSSSSSSSSTVMAAFGQQQQLGPFGGKPPGSPLRGRGPEVTEGQLVQTQPMIAQATASDVIPLPAGPMDESLPSDESSAASASLSQMSLPGGSSAEFSQAGVMSLPNELRSAVSSSPALSPPPRVEPAVEAPGGGVGLDRGQSLLLLDSAFRNIPHPRDSERPKHYLARNPVPTPASFPQVPALLLDNPVLWERMDTDVLFFAFYYQQGTYQQYLAARELKKQSWRYHKKYNTWFQRHEEPKITTDEFEQGTYVYFDFHIVHDDLQTGWCQRIKTEFTFEYSYLEDELVV